VRRREQRARDEPRARSPRQLARSRDDSAAVAKQGVSLLLVTIGRLAHRRVPRKAAASSVTHGGIDWGIDVRFAHCSRRSMRRPRAESPARRATDASETGAACHIAHRSWLLALEVHTMPALFRSTAFFGFAALAATLAAQSPTFAPLTTFGAA